jgi:hypothetical protein
VIGWVSAWRSACHDWATMSQRHGSLLMEVQRDALDRETPLADTLRKLIALGGMAGSVKLRDWASRELRGYAGIDGDLPAYRKITGSLQIDAVKGNRQVSQLTISPVQVPEAARHIVADGPRLSHGVGEIESIAAYGDAEGGHVKLALPRHYDVAHLWNLEVGDTFQHINAIYWSISSPSVRGALDGIRTTLVELVAEMQAGLPDPKANPSQELADRAVNIAVYGEGARLNVTTAMAIGSGSHEVKAGGTYVEARQVEVAWPALHDQLAGLGVPDHDLEALHSALLTDGDPTTGELGSATSTWIGRLGAKVASGTVALVGAASTDAVTQLILKALGIG